MEDSISKLSDLLSTPEGAQRIKELLGSLGSGGQNNEQDASISIDDMQDGAAGASARQQSSSGGGGFNLNNTEFISKIAEVTSLLNDQNDSRVALLSSLRPFLNSKRSSHLDSAMRIMQITKLSGLLKGPLGR